MFQAAPWPSLKMKLENYPTNNHIIRATTHNQEVDWKLFRLRNTKNRALSRPNIYPTRLNDCGLLSSNLFLFWHAFSQEIREEPVQSQPVPGVPYRSLASSSTTFKITQFCKFLSILELGKKAKDAIWGTSLFVALQCLSFNHFNIWIRRRVLASSHPR